MTVEVKVPFAGESITEVYVGRWLKQEGGEVAKDEPVVEIETDKATVEVYAPVAGTLAEVLKRSGDSARVGEVLARIDEGARGREERGAAAPGEPGMAGRPSAGGPGVSAREAETRARTTAEEQIAPVPPEVPPRETRPRAVPPHEARDTGAGKGPRVMPAAQRLLDEHGLDARDVEATGPGGRLLKEDVQRHLEGEPGGRTAAPQLGAVPAEPSPAGAAAAPAESGEREEEVVPMSPLRRTIARRLVEAQQSSALLTTFNEIDMTAVMALRSDHQERFEKRHGARLGFMSFFVKASIDALKQFPQINAEIREQSIVYKNYHDIAVAVSTPRGLVTPVLRNAERLGFAEIETAIGDFGRRAQENKLGPDELRGGTFTISNGGVFGSLLSTPLVNPPQSGVLGMHAIQQRPVAQDGQVVIRPMMYVALTYDHRIVDGREAVTFLRHIKDTVEAPARMLLEV